MITYVNTVLVSNSSATALMTQATVDALTTQADIAAKKGSFIVENMDDDALDTLKDAKSIRIGMLTGTSYAVTIDGVVTYKANIKWSNTINKDTVKSFEELNYTAAKATTEDTIKIDFTKASANMKTVLASGNKEVFLRLTYKDLPTRYRNWTESYDYLTANGDTPAIIATALAATINKQYKRARVTATAADGVLTLVAMPYDDDDASDTINMAGKVRFNANVYYKDPSAAAFASSNRYAVEGVTIAKTEGYQYPAGGKLVRDRENWAMGYQGILSKGEGVWPIIKPETEAVNTTNYDALTIQFENSHRTADDLMRQTKQALEVYGVAANIAALKTAVSSFFGIATTTTGA